MTTRETSVIDEVRSKIRESYKKNDERGMRDALHALINNALSEQLSESHAADVLEFFGAHYQATGLIAEIYSKREKFLAGKIEELQAAISADNQLIEKLELIINIQQMQQDPRQLAEIRIKEMDRQLDSTRRESAEIKESLVSRIQTLRGTL